MLSKMKILFPNELKTSIRKHLDAAGFSNVSQFVEKVSIRVVQSGGGVSFVPLSRSHEISDIAIDLRAVAFQDDSQAVLAQQMLLQNRLEDINHHLSNEMSALRGEMKKMSNSLRSLMNRPAVVVNRGIQPSTSLQLASQPLSRTLVKLSKCPRNLHDLWNEWEFGLQGNKAAKAFTSEERGQNRLAFSRRKVFWGQVNNMIARGHTSSTAIIDKIYSAYGRRLCVSAIINKIRKDRENPHPELN